MYVFSDINLQNLANPPNSPNPCKPIHLPSKNPYPWPGVRVWRVGVGVQLKYPRVTRDNLYVHLPAVMLFPVLVSVIGPPAIAIAVCGPFDVVMSMLHHKKNLNKC